MNKTLPPHPSLEHLKAQAKDLLIELRKSSPSTRLHHAQRQLATEYGFASWPKLMKHVQSLELAHQPPDLAIETLENGIRQGRFATAAREVARAHPNLSTATLACALTCLNEAAASRMLQGADVVSPTGHLPAAPIVYVAFSPFASERPDAYVRLIQTLLDAGASPNTTFTGPDFPEYPLSVLYGASAVACSPEATRILLSAGANPNDGESVYHACENRDHACLKLLLDHGAKMPGNEILHMLDYEDLPGLKLMLAAGGRPNESHALIHALRRGRSPEIIQALIDAGAEPSLNDAKGVTARQLAFERGINLPALTEGYEPSATDILLAACWRGDVKEATRLKGTFAEVQGIRRKALTDACWEGRSETIDAFIAAGFTVLDRDDSGGTPLHCAAFAGKVETVKALLRHNPPLDDAADMYHAIPLQWAAHASEYGQSPGDHVEVVRVLATAGSPPPQQMMGSEAVRALLGELWPALVTSDVNSK